MERFLEGGRRGRGTPPHSFHPWSSAALYPFTQGIIVFLTSEAVANQLKPKLGTKGSKCSQQEGSMGSSDGFWHCALRHGGLIPSSGDVRIDLSPRTPRALLWWGETPVPFCTTQEEICIVRLVWKQLMSSESRKINSQWKTWSAKMMCTSSSLESNNGACHFPQYPCEGHLKQNYLRFT